MGRRKDNVATRKVRKLQRDIAVERKELLWPTNEREAASGPVSAPIKARDPEVDRLVSEFLSRHAE